MATVRTAWANGISAETWPIWLSSSSVTGHRPPRDDPGRPWFCYLSFGANGAPHIGPREWTDKYRNRFEMGYDRYRDVALSGMKRLGMGAQKTGPTDRESTRRTSSTP